MNAQMIPITKIVRGNNPRTQFDPGKLQELAASIKARGLIQPIIVEPHGRGKFLLVAGERRLEAHKLLKRSTIKALVRERTNHNGRERLLDAVIENDQRTDVDPIDRANAYLQLRDTYHLTTRQIAQKVGRESHVIENHLVLTRLDPEIQDLVRQGFWTDSRLVRGLLSIEDRSTRISLAGQLWSERINLKGCLAAVDRTLAAIGTKVVRKGGRPRKAGPAALYSQKTKIVSTHVPAMEIAEVWIKPARWDALKQLGHVPEWDLVVSAAGSTCQMCPLRDIASPKNCEGCAAVTLLQRLCWGEASQ